LRSIDYAPHVDIGHEAPTATDNIEKNQNGMTFRVYVNPGDTIVAPRAGMEVVWVRWDTVTNAEVPNGREFAGVLTSVKESTYNGVTLIYDCSAQSYQYWFDRRLVYGFFQQESANLRINNIVTKYTTGFTTNNVNAPLTIVSDFAQYERPSNFMKKCVQQIGYGWYVDHYKDVHTFRQEDFVSPLPSNILDIDNDVVNYGDLTLEENSENVYNRFTIRGYKMRSPTSYTFNYVGDGTTTQWSLGYRVSSAKGDITVTVGGVNYPVKKDVLDGIPGQGGTLGVAYVHFTQHQLRFAAPPAAGAIISVFTFPLIDKTRIDQDDASVQYMKALENTPASDGVREYSQLDKSLTQSTQDTITAKLQLLALKYGYPAITGSFTSFTQGWNAGQMFRMLSARRLGGISIDQRFYVYRVTKKWIQNSYGGTTAIQYQVEFADKPYLI
jgi:hypothetical protein